MNHLKKIMKISFAALLIAVTVPFTTASIEAKKKPSEKVEISYDTDNQTLTVYVDTGFQYVEEYSKKDKQVVEHLIIKKDVTAIPKNSFAGFTNLKTVTFQNQSKLVEIGGEAFKNTKNLTTITLPNSLKKISASAFENSGIKSIVLPKGLETIGKRTFANTSNLTEIEVPASVVEVKENAFLNSSISAITFLGDYPTLDDGIKKILNTHVYYMFDTNGWAQTGAKLSSNNIIPITDNFEGKVLGSTTQSISFAQDSAEFDLSAVGKNKIIAADVKVYTNNQPISEYTYNAYTNKLTIDVKSLRNNTSYTFGTFLVEVNMVDESTIQYDLVNKKVQEGNTLQLEIKDLPKELENKKISWTLTNDSKKYGSIKKGVFTPTKTGTAKVKVVIEDGISKNKDYKATYTIKIIDMHTITLLPGQLSGTNVEIIVQDKTNFTLPECPFELPKGIVVKEWRAINSGNEFSVGEQVKIKNDKYYEPILSYEIDSVFTSGEKHEVTRGNDVTFKLTGYVEHFTSLYINGQLVDPSNYTLESGSVVITLHKEYINTLTIGTYDVVVTIGESTPNASLIVKQAPIVENTVGQIPQAGVDTSDTTNIINYVGLLCVSVLTALLLIRKCKAV